MNGTINNLTAAGIKTLTQETYESRIQILIDISGLGVVVYAALSKLPNEVEHIWMKPFNLPALLYIFARYATLFLEGFTVLLDFEALGGACNALANAINSVGVFSSIGVQGLLIARAYSLCQGNKFLSAALVVDFLLGLSLYLYDIITLPGCSTRSEPTIPAKDALILFVTNIVDLVGDVLILAICVWKIWGTWKLGREAGIHTIVSIILKQSLLRFCFVVVFGITRAVILAILGSSESLIADSFTRLQNVLSSVLVADFTLDLRRFNAARIDASNISLPTLRFTNALQHTHQSILKEMATPEDRSAEDEGEGYATPDDGASAI